MIPFGYSIHVYMRSQTLNPMKGYPKYNMVIFVGKTDSQDIWIISDGERIIFTRNVGRMYRPWTIFLAYYMRYSSIS